MARSDMPETTSRLSFGSPVLWAVAIFGVINLCLFGFNPPVRISPTDFPVKTTWQWLRTNSYLNADRTPDVVLLGTSLIMIPMAVVDADYLETTIDAVKHPEASYLAHVLQTKLRSKNISCFNFGLPGGMISDDYLVARALLTGSRKPKVIVLSVSLRDTIDNGVSSPLDTPTFQFFKHFVPVEEIQDLALSTVPAWCEYWQGRLTFLWDKRLELQALSNTACSRVVPLPEATIANADLLSDLGADRGKQSANINLFAANQVQEGQFLIAPDNVTPYSDNQREYKRRYRTANVQLFENQKKFLERFLQLTHSKGVEVLLVNMPVTEQNMGLMPEGAYPRYMTALKQLSSQYNVSLLDLNDGKGFSVADFNDSAHMNGRGGKRLAHEIANRLCQDGTLQGILLADDGPIKVASATTHVK